METKLFIPQVREGLVWRSRLLEKLEEMPGKKLALISAPAGYGKSTLLIQWIHHSKIKSAWFSLDGSENEPSCFFTCLISALQQLYDDAGKAAMQLLKSPQVRIQTVIISLLNDLVKRTEKTILVLDDYHLIENSAVHSALDYFIEHAPPHTTVVLSSRSDPSLPLSRYRSRNELLEIRAQDLCFTIDETEKYLNEQLHLNLSKDDINALTLRTEGWIAGLHLAALSLKGQANITEFVRAFKADNRYIADYLLEQVLHQQPPDVFNFLLKTSILKRLTAPLCDRLTGRNDSQYMLEALEKINLFLFPLDHQRQWFRYHHLFADLLHQRLITEYSDADVRYLHRTASAWHSDNNMSDAAVSHALAAQDYERAAELIEQIAEVDWDRGMESTLLKWLNTLPPKYISTNPKMYIFYARELLENNQADLAIQQIANAEKLLAKKKYSSEIHDSVRGRIALIRGVMAAYQGDIPNIITHTTAALKLLPKGDEMWRAVAATNLGFAYGWSGLGDLPKAQQAFENARDISDSAGNMYFYLLAGSCAAGVMGLRGQLKASYAEYEKLLEVAHKQDLQQLGITGTLHISMGGAQGQWMDFDSALSMIERGMEISKVGQDVIVLASGELQKSRIFIYRGQFEEALKSILNIKKETELFALPPWIHHSAEAVKAGIWVAMSKLELVETWVRERGLGVDDELSHRREQEHYTLVMYLIARGQFERALKLLFRLVDEATVYDRIHTLIELLILRALVHRQIGNVDSAINDCSTALSLAEPGQFLASFVSRGDSVESILKTIETTFKRSDYEYHGFSKNYLKRLLVAFKVKDAGAANQQLQEPLSDRELDVLMLIAAGLSNQQIAGKLFISLNTTKSHVKRINAKLDAHNRTEAVHRAQELGLL
ncbi:hypothetical protein JXA02_02330 [candidate division KSB1 bacterium]|nr:hypothetical protein [candidate division KSB1 bacterium]